VVYQEILATDAYGNVTAAELNDGRIETFADYEPDSGRLENLSAYRSTGQELQDVDYLFDVLGNLKHRHERTGSRNTKERFTYDNLNRLKTAQLSFNGGGVKRHPVSRTKATPRLTTASAGPASGAWTSG